QLARYGASPPEQSDNFFGQKVSLGANYAAVQNGHDTPGVTIFRLDDDALDAAIAAPVLPAYGSRSPAARGFRLPRDTPPPSADMDQSGWSFAGGYVFTREGGAWTQQTTFDATPFLGLVADEDPLASDLAYDGTTVVLAVVIPHGSPQTFRAATAFFDLPQ